MQLSADAVNWENLEHACKEGVIEDILLEEVAWDEEIQLTNTPWPSDSVGQYIDTAEAIVAIEIPGADREALQVLINEDINFPNELSADVDPELIAGALSPETVVRYAELFFRLVTYPLDQEVKEYLEQWYDMLKFSAERRAGVIFHLG